MKRCTIRGIKFTETDVPKRFVSTMNRQSPIAFVPENPDDIFRIRVWDKPCFPDDVENPVWMVEYIDRVDAVAVITSDSPKETLEKNPELLRVVKELAKK